MGGMVMDEGGDRRSKIPQIKRRAISTTTPCCVIVVMIILIIMVVIGLVMGFFIGDKFGPTIKGLFTNDVPSAPHDGMQKNGTDGNGTGGAAYAWSQWSACSKTCGGGMRTRSHVCGGQDCSTDTMPCNNHTCPNTCFCPNAGAILIPDVTRPRDCADVKMSDAKAASDMYTVYPEGVQGGGVKVYCDMETDGGGWTVFQRRNCGCIDFFRNWTEYALGFGCLPGEHWLGNNYLHILTSRTDRPMTLRVDLTDWSQPAQHRHALYRTFSIGNASESYPMTIAGYSGDASDSMTRNNKMKFSARDRDNDVVDKSHCAQLYVGAWWYDACHEANLNGLYYSQAQSPYGKGLNWRHWKGYYYSMKETEMKVRPNNYLIVCPCAAT